jgi:hypothetical protein
MTDRPMSRSWDAPSDATDVLTQQDVGRTIPVKFLLRKTVTAAWIAMIATELH